MLITLALIVEMALIGLAGSVAFGGALSRDIEPRQSKMEPVRTGKERLGGKSSDEQRVDNCNVPLELRGPKPRPDHCVGDVGTRSAR
jgi:hypothetical protein